VRLADVPPSPDKPKEHFERKVGKPFFDISKPEEEISQTKKVTREQRLKGNGLPANRLASALTKILNEPIPKQPKKELLSTNNRGARIDELLYNEITELTSKRGIPMWVRESIEFIAENSVPIDNLIAEAEYIAQRRKNNINKSIIIPLGSTLLETIKILGKRSRLTDKEVIEACISIYYKVHLKAMADEKEP